ncbi:polysaccharide biosynthesis/export family protein [Calycomorphotria hydatis]|nr:polysaccharide biosynthesis/export family protein [Calycomorphotria hydatis]
MNHTHCNQANAQRPRLGTQSLIWCAIFAVVGSLTGCSALRPIIGVPAERLPISFTCPTRSGRELIDLSLLRQTPPSEYRVDSNDVLGIYIEGILGNDGTNPPISNNNDLRPSLGFPVRVELDGTINLPAAGPIMVRGLTLQEVREHIREIYTDELQLLQPDYTRVPVLVSLQKPRTYRVLVIRQEVGQDGGLDLGAEGGGLEVVRRGIGRVVELPAYENDVLHALAATGGLPGLDAEDAVFVVRSGMGCLPCRGNNAAPNWGGHTVPTPAPPEPERQASLQTVSAVTSHPDYIAFNQGHVPTSPPPTLRIPLRAFPGTVPPFTEADITLNDGDVVYIDSRVQDFFYTGGLLGGGQYMLPRDYDIDAMAAVAIVQGQRVNQNVPTRAIGGFSSLNKDVTVGASELIVLRPRCDGSYLPIKVDLYDAINDPAQRVLIRPGDYLILQYTKKEAVGAWFERHIFEGLVLGISSAFVFN